MTMGMIREYKGFKANQHKEKNAGTNSIKESGHANIESTEERNLRAKKTGAKNLIGMGLPREAVARLMHLEQEICDELFGDRNST